MSDINKLESILNGFNEEKQSFGYNPDVRGHKKFNVTFTSDEVQTDMDYDNEMHIGRNALYNEKNRLVNISGGKKVWTSMNKKFRNGDSTKFMFINDDNNDDNNVTMKPTRFTTGINIKRELEAMRQKKEEEERRKADENRFINRAEWQHMSYHVPVNDRSTARVISERKKNTDGNYNREHEFGNTHKITKEYSIKENEKILSSGALPGESHKVFRFNTTLVMDKNGNCEERDDLMCKNNINIMNSDINDEGNYKKMLHTDNVPAS